MTLCIMVIIFGGFTTFSMFFPFPHKPSITVLIYCSVHDFDVSSFITTYFPIPFFAVLFFGYKFWNKTKTISYDRLDFVTGSSEDIPETPVSRSVWKKFSENI